MNNGKKNFIYIIIQATFLKYMKKFNINKGKRVNEPATNSGQKKSTL